MKTLIILALITAMLLWYALQGRDWLKSKPWAQPFFAWVEPYEIFLFKKSETILVARTLKWLGYVLTGLQQFNGVDLGPILPFVPEKYQFALTTAVNSAPLLISAIGWIIERLRNRTTLPIQVVAVAEKDVTPKLAAAVTLLEDVKGEAVQAAAEAKAA